MKIIQKTENELIAKEGKSFGVFIGSAFVLAGLFIMYSTDFHGSDNSLIVRVAIPSLFIIVGLAAVLFSSSVLITINKLTGQINYEKKSFVKQDVKTYAISDVLQVELRRTWKMEQTGSSSQGNLKQHKVLVSTSFFVLKNGGELFLSQEEHTSPVGALVFGQNGKSGSDAEIAAFLGVEFKVLDPSSFGVSGIGMNVGGITI
jgi:ABC-type transport system involved in multi-copper enzyme maturation permease subunit